ncbi:MAG TPA: glycosyltransferase [Candidatus Poseidoniales archaeon]|nr:MAG TPA: glycosyltransferase [Candidatus Poseidoniales archaeon]HII58605.1 glycosyltransferase family 4 protein [Candidatus Poseidoniaceae archaeon]
MAKRVMLVRGGVLGRNSGLGSAHHNLADLLGSGSVPGWETDSVCEYELSSRASPILRLWKRWYSHPKAVKKAISKSISKGSCDLVHITDQEQAHLIPKNSKLPVVVTVHDLFHLFPTKMMLGEQEIDIGEQNPPSYRRRDIKKLKRGLARSDLLVCDSKATLRDCQKYFPNVKSICVPLGIDVSSYSPNNRTVEVEPINDRCNLLIVGSNDPRKRMDFICKILGSIESSILNELQIHHVGLGESNFGQPAIIDLALENKVNNWTGHGPSVSESKLMQLRDISECLLFPSASEGFGYPPLEALASGLPVLCADLPSHNELMPDGYCLPAEDIESWKDSIIEIYHNWKNRDGNIRDFPDEIVEHAKKFDNSVFSSRMADAYNSLGSEISL